MNRQHWQNLGVACLVCIAGLCNGTMDTLQFHFSRSYFSRPGFDEQFWNPAVSWKNKYQNGDPAQGEKFWLSSGALVALTDAWHLFKLGMLKSFLLAIVFFRPYLRERGAKTLADSIWKNVAAFVTFHMAFHVGFALAYR